MSKEVLEKVVKDFQEMSIQMGGTEGDVVLKNDGIHIGNEKLLNAMVNVFANKMREEGYTEEEVKAYIENPYQE